ncbi:hypothetical protein [Stigmatella aurantiaca]|uniref:Uncharacterized protein n=2 Tax=Stigmatella aurantiaca (strain DW4/3-1) TaxID=378806 RepID=E3FTE1_STIAD|nr:hypothetical protein [Stigmatella aurantiaca]ADO68355.1 uncharacterized protein STAUR_0551 [Stigmatella aurantiaca DW4/3-1]
MDPLCDLEHGTAGGMRSPPGLANRERAGPDLLGQWATTDCAPGYACSDTFTEARQCLAVCDPLAAVPGCPSGTVCGVYGLCIEQSVMVPEPIGFAFDPALMDETCSMGYAEFCWMVR